MVVPALERPLPNDTETSLLPGTGSGHAFSVNRSITKNPSGEIVALSGKATVALPKVSVHPESDTLDSPRL